MTDPFLSRAPRAGLGGVHIHRLRDEAMRLRAQRPGYTTKLRETGRGLLNESFLAPVLPLPTQLCDLSIYVTSVK